MSPLSPSSLPVIHVSFLTPECRPYTSDLITLSNVYSSYKSSFREVTTYLTSLSRSRSFPLNSTRTLCKASSTSLFNLFLNFRILFCLFLSHVSLYCVLKRQRNWCFCINFRSKCSSLRQCFSGSVFHLIIRGYSLRIFEVPTTK